MSSLILFNCDNYPNQDEIDGECSMDDGDTDICSEADQNARNAECYDRIDSNEMLLVITVDRETD